MLKVPTRLMLTARWNTSSGCGPSLPTVLTAGATPAQLTRPRSVPMADGGVDDGLAVGFRVTSQRDELALQLGSQCLARLGLHVGDDDLAAVLGEHARGGGAKARRAAGDDEDVILDLHGCPF